MIRQKTIFKKQAINPNYAQLLYNTLEKDIKWTDGIYSRKYGGSTRKAYAMNRNDPMYPSILKTIDTVLSTLTERKYMVLGIYFNYYENGNMFTPSHSHKGSHQMVLSLGTTRSLKISSKVYSMENGDAVLFGSSPHGVPKEEHVKKGRISIATFMIPL